MEFSYFPLKSSLEAKFGDEHLLSIEQISLFKNHWYSDAVQHKLSTINVQLKFFKIFGSGWEWFSSWFVFLSPQLLCSSSKWEIGLYKKNRTKNLTRRVKIKFTFLFKLKLQKIEYQEKRLLVESMMFIDATPMRKIMLYQ